MISKQHIVVHQSLLHSYKGPWFGTRHVLALMGFLGFVNVYAMRVNLSVAIVVMVNQTYTNNNSSSNGSASGTCPAPVTPINSTTPHDADGPFDWDEKTQSLVLGSFFYGYVLTQLPGGRLAEMFGGKWIYGCGILITSVFTLLMPLAAKLDFRLLIAVRVIEGLGEGVTFPVMHAMIAEWAPPLERSKMSTFIYAGSMMGTVISLPMTGLICDYVGWEAAFYIFGSFGIVWFAFWTFLAYDTPAK
jgi:ACS family sodium-dependent inorganic phosphate cotransporter-like MFS transporter 5